MRRGPWHQCGDRSQTIALELLRQGAGVGVIISPRDISFQRAAACAELYRDAGAEVLADPQFYIPHYVNDNLTSYPMSPYRTAVSALGRIGDVELGDLGARLRTMNQEIGASAVIAPALAYQAGNPGIDQLNSRFVYRCEGSGRQPRSTHLCNRRFGPVCCSLFTIRSGRTFSRHKPQCWRVVLCF